MKNSLTLLNNFFLFKQNKVVFVLTCSMHMHCRPIEKNNAQFTYKTKIISFAIKKVIIFESHHVRRWILERICASHVGLKVEYTVVKNWFLQIRDILKDRPSCSLPFNVLTLTTCSVKNCFPCHWLLAYVTKISLLKSWSSATDVNHTVYQPIHEIKSILNITYMISILIIYMYTSYIYIYIWGTCYWCMNTTITRMTG
jgi:hypothetical protein